MWRTSGVLLFLFSSALLTTACPPDAEPGDVLVPKRAVAEMSPTEGHDTRGTVAFEEVGDRARITVDVTGLSAGSRHGFHVHEFGDCSAADSSSERAGHGPGSRPPAAAARGLPGFCGRERQRYTEAPREDPREARVAKPPRPPARKASWLPAPLSHFCPRRSPW